MDATKRSFTRYGRRAPWLSLAVALCACSSRPGEPEDGVRGGLSITTPGTGAVVVVSAGGGGAAGTAVPAGTGGAGGGAGGVPARPAATLTIAIPRHGDGLYDSPRFTSFWYDRATATITVAGSISGVTARAIASGNLQLLIDGRFPGTLTWNAATNGAEFSGRTNAWIDPEWVQRGVMVELVDIPSNTVVGRDMVTYFDLRATPEASPSADPDVRIDGMFAQLTDFGAGNDPSKLKASALERPHLASLPHPGLASFNRDLGGSAAALPLVDDPSQQLGACIDLKDAVAMEPRLTTLGAYVGVDGALTQALASYVLYQGYQDQSMTCSAIATSLAGVSFGISLLLTFACDATMASWCVQHTPAVDDFELCVDRLAGDPTDLSIGKISDVSLAFAQTPTTGTGARLDSQVTVKGIKGRVNGFLRGMSIRWKAGTCIGRPQQAVADADIESTDWLSAWTTCEGIEVDADKASTLVTDQSVELVVTPDVRNAERVAVTQERDGLLTFSGKTVNADKGVCAQPFINPDAEAMADSYHAAFQRVLNDRWNAGGAHTQQAEAMELLLGRFDLGLIAHADHAVEAKLDPLVSLVLAGTLLDWKTHVVPTASADRLRQRSTFFYHPAPLPAQLRLDALDPLGAPMDLSFTLTTGFLNQTLHALAPTSRLIFDFQPSWDELALVGVTPSNTGLPATTAPPLNGTVLGRIEPMFNELGTTTVQIHVSPSLDPLVWMNPDPPGFLGDPVTGAPLAYGVSGLEIRFAEPDVFDPATSTTIPGKEWLRLVLGFDDPSFSLDFAAQASDFLQAGYVDDEWGLSVKSNAFSSCPKVPHGLLQPATSCERELETLLLALFKGRLQGIFLGLLSEIAAPQVWDAGGQVAAAPRITPTTRYQMNQLITLFGDVPDSP